MRNRQIFAWAAVLTLSACSGGPSIPAGPVDGTFDRQGGTLTTRGEDGSTFALTLPSGAVGEPTDLALAPLPAQADEYLRFELAPAGLEFATPASLRVTLPEGTTLGADAQLYFGSLSGDLDVLPTTVDPQARTLTAEIERLGTGRRSPLAGLQQGGGGGSEGGAAPSAVVCDAQLELMKGAMDELYASSGTLFPAAELLIDTMQDVLDGCAGSFVAFAAEQRPLVQAALDDATNDLEVVLVDSYGLLAGALPPVITYCGVLVEFAEAQGEAIENCLPTSVIEEKFSQLGLFLEDKYTTDAFGSDYWRVEREIHDLIEIGENAARLGYDNVTDILMLLADLASGLREAAWAYCVATRVQYPLWRQLQFANVPFVAFDLDQVFGDVDSCGSALEVAVFTPTGRKLEGQSKRFDFTGSNPGGVTSAPARSPVTGRILVSGDVLPLRCGRPLGAEGFGTDQLEIRLGGAVLDTLTRVGDRFLTEPLTLDLATALAAADVDPLDPPDEVRLEVWRVAATTTCLDDDEVAETMTTALPPETSSLVASVAYRFDPEPVITGVEATPASIPARKTTTVTLSVGYRDAGENIVSPAGAGFGQASGVGTVDAAYTPECQDENYTVPYSVQLRDAFDQTSATAEGTVSVDVMTTCVFEIISVSYDDTVVSGEPSQEEGIVVTYRGNPPLPYNIVVRPRSCPAGATCASWTDLENSPPIDTDGFRCQGVTDEPLEFDYEIFLESGWESADEADYLATSPYPVPFTCLPEPD